MSVTNEEYQEALNVVAAKEYALVQQFETILASYLESINELVENLDDLKADLPTNRLGQSSVRNQIDSAYNQLRSFKDQATFLRNNIKSIADQYNNPQGQMMPQPPVTPTPLP